MAENDMNTGPAWPEGNPTELGIDPDRLAEAVKIAMENETRYPRSMYIEGTYIGSYNVDDKPPYNYPMGPVVERGGPAGLILKGGKMVAKWGDIRRADMTFSIAKSYLGVLAGLAYDDGLIKSVDEPIGETVKDGGFEDAHNSQITWRHLLQQTSEWHGELFERPDSVDWNRKVGPDALKGVANDKGHARELKLPGTHFEYNDVRVNRLGLALLQLFRRPLPIVLKERIMDPIGCSSRWAWHGYDTSWVEIDGKRMQSVPGGSHWGGGIVIDACDHARFGELIGRKGEWDGRQLLSRQWIDEMLTPSEHNQTYGYLWWLNTDRQQYSSLPASSFFALGGGVNIIWVDPQLDLVVVVRWLDRPITEQLLGAIAAAVI